MIAARFLKPPVKLLKATLASSFLACLLRGKIPTAPTNAPAHPIPARIHDSANKDLWVMTLGDVETPLADGILIRSKTP